MSELDRLIAELCPDGVEYKALGEVATDIYRGAGIKREEVTESGIPCVRYGEIYTTYNIWFDTCVSHTKEGSKTFEHGDILFAITGENVDEIAKSCVYLGHEKCLAGGDIVVMKHEQNPKYLAYALSTTEAQLQKSKGRVKSKVVHSSIPALKGIVVPLPPFSVQCEIVRILDNFTKLTAELTAELSAELSARKKQYEYYSQKLISNQPGAVFYKLRELGKWYGGGTPSTSNPEFWNDGTVPWLTSKDMGNPCITDTQMHIHESALEKSSAKMLPKDIVAVVVRSGILRHSLPIVFVPFPTTVNQDIKALAVDSKIVMARYAFHAMLANRNDLLLKTRKTGGTVESIEVQKLLDYEVPVPPIAEQQRIIAILDRFNALSTDIAVGLPAEVEARRKQYEYYRDELLSFNATSKKRGGFWPWNRITIGIKRFLIS